MYNFFKFPVKNFTSLREIDRERFRTFRFRQHFKHLNLTTHLQRLFQTSELIQEPFSLCLRIPGDQTNPFKSIITKYKKEINELHQFQICSNKHETPLVSPIPTLARKSRYVQGIHWCR